MSTLIVNENTKLRMRMGAPLEKYCFGNNDYRVPGIKNVYLPDLWTHVSAIFRLF